MPPPLPSKRGPLFGTDEEMQPDLQGDALAGMGGNSLGGETVQDLGGYNAGALVNPDEVRERNSEMMELTTRVRAAAGQARNAFDAAERALAQARATPKIRQMMAANPGLASACGLTIEKPTATKRRR